LFFQESLPAGRQGTCIKSLGNFYSILPIAIGRTTGPIIKELYFSKDRAAKIMVSPLNPAFTKRIQAARNKGR